MNTPLPEGVSAEEVATKVAAGLTRAQAIEVIQNQQAHDASPGAEDAAPSLEDLKVPELKELAAGKGIEVTSDMKKADIIAAINAHEAESLTS